MIDCKFHHKVDNHAVPSVAASRLAGIASLDGVFMNFKDPDGFAASCSQSKLLGFDGMFC